MPRHYSIYYLVFSSDLLDCLFGGVISDFITYELGEGCAGFGLTHSLHSKVAFALEASRIYRWQKTIWRSTFLAIQLCRQL